MRRSLGGPSALFAFLGAGLLLVTANAQAGSSRATKGDAEAILNAQDIGDSRTLRQFVGPAGAFIPNAIRITAFVDGQHYCSLDSHVMAVTFDEGNATGETRSQRESQMRCQRSR